jgi:signal transduction histidine kinase
VGDDHLTPETVRHDPLTFPDQPRLELDQLLGQLVARAQEVLATQGRLRGLLHANQMIIGDLALPGVLRSVVDAARELVGARYAALGVIAPEGGLAEFVHLGMPDGAVERIGHLPQGKGLLGALIDDPEPIRLARIGDDPRSAGFPPGHPPMGSFLGVPIRVRDEVFGNLYLAESTGGEFTAEDEQLAEALAATAGMVIANARHYQAARTRQQWLQATATITSALLSAGPDEPLRLIAQRSLEITDADLVTVVVPDESGDELRAVVAVGAGAGAGAGELTGRRIAREGSLCGLVLTSGTPVRLFWPDESTGLTSLLCEALDVGPLLAVPLVGSGTANGVLTVGRRRGKPAFGAEDLEMAAGFANHASIAIELADARRRRQRAAMLEDRERIAADLHDHVIQRLFAAGLSLQGVAGGLEPGRDTDRVLRTIDDLDDTITQIRTTIFQLNRRTAGSDQRVRTRLLAVVTDAGGALGFEPAVRFSGLLEDNLADDLVEDVVAVLREAVSNVARHARATSAEIALATTGEQVVIRVSDNGVGMGPATRRSGLANLRRRAERRGGSFVIESGEPSGTRLCWSSPIR